MTPEGRGRVGAVGTGVFSGHQSSRSSRCPLVSVFSVSCMEMATRHLIGVGSVFSPEVWKAEPVSLAVALQPEPVSQELRFIAWTTVAESRHFMPPEKQP